jgi:hypothetical protein
VRDCLRDVEYKALEKLRNNLSSPRVFRFLNYFLLWLVAVSERRIMKIIKALTFALCALVSVMASAERVLLSCSAKAVFGRASDLSVHEREVHNPSIIIDLAANTIGYAYSRDSQSFQFLYEIQEQVNGVIWAVEPSQIGSKNHLSFDMHSLKFSTTYLNGELNTLKFGSCVKSI